MNIKAIIQQPSTILGIGTLIGTIAGIVAHVLTHDTTATAGAGAIVFAIVHMVMPDNSAAPSAVEKLATDTVAAIMQQRLAAALPALFADGVAVVQAFQPPPAAAPVVTPPAAPVAVAPAGQTPSPDEAR